MTYNAVTVQLTFSAQQLLSVKLVDQQLAASPHTVCISNVSISVADPDP
jgi:hypothetical protein